MNLIEIYRRLSDKVSRLDFEPPVSHVYNPLEYARLSHEDYLTRFGRPPKRVVFLGMNPGPFGMAQTGIPFGDVETVANWLVVHQKVEAPQIEHPKRPIRGLECPRVEVSGARLWSWIRTRWVTPKSFFEEVFVANYCPLVFLEAGGRNRTPDRLPRGERLDLFNACDEALAAVVDHLKPEWVVGIGAFAHRRAVESLARAPVRIGKILHPSPASPAANRGWREVAEKQLAEQRMSP